MKLLILSDIHANWAALEAIAAVETDADGAICLGDIVNYGPHPAACVEWVRSRVRPDWVVQGNHDRAIGRGEDPRCSAAYRDLAAAMQTFTEAALTAEQRHWLGSRPIQADLGLDGRVAYLCHAIPTSPLYDYVEADDITRWQREVARAGEPDLLLVGHIHQPFRRRVGRTEVINPGSVGQAKHGTGGEACYAVWRDGEVSLRRVSYDAHAVVDALRNCAPVEIARRLGNVLLTGDR